jgi:hypothetical protein
MPNSSARHRQRLVPPVDCSLSRDEFVAILFDHGLDDEDAHALFDVLRISDSQLIIDALALVAMRPLGRGARTRARRYN